MLLKIDSNDIPRGKFLSGLVEADQIRLPSGFCTKYTENISTCSVW